MPDIVMANSGVPILLNYMLQRVPNNYPDWLLMLWTNSTLDPVPTTIYSEFDEATFSGYARRVILHTGWGAPAFPDVVNCRSTYLYPFSWLNAGPAQAIYGYAVIEPVAFTLLWSQKFDLPATVAGVNPLAFKLAIGLGTLT